jgi:polysaccharide export outer membrane protein
MRLRHAFFATAVLLSAAPAAAQSDGAGASAASAAVLRPGDAIRISVWRKPELSGEFIVAGDSSIAHPFYGDLRVGGIPFLVATERVRRFVERFETSPRVLVEPLYQVAVTGEVHAPKLYTLRPEVTIAQAVGMAGGATQAGEMNRVRLLRAGNVHLIDLTQPGDPLAQTPIVSGDQIVVPRRRDILREYVAPLSSVFAAVVSLLGLVITATAGDSDAPPT